MNTRSPKARGAHRDAEGGGRGSSSPTDILIGGYLSKDAAEEDYNAVLDSGGDLQGAVVVSKDLEGNLSVEQTDHMVREGAAGLGAIGFAVGLFAPPLLAATAIGGALGAGVGKLAHSKATEFLDERVEGDMKPTVLEEVQGAIDALVALLPDDMKIHTIRLTEDAVMVTACPDGDVIPSRVLAVPAGVRTAAQG